MIAREIAEHILTLRRLLTTVAVARAAGNDDDAGAALHQMDLVIMRIPLGLRRDVQMQQRVQCPVDRMLERDGYLAAAERVGYRA